jgi:hypothetical protein
VKDQWYADNRDLVKWGVLLNLARHHAAARILQVAYYRPSKWGLLEIDGEKCPIPDAVLRHFRDVRKIKELSADPRIEVVEAKFADRGQYTEAVLRAIASRPNGEACVVFLDPDTGLAPRRPLLKHALESELTDIWHHMSVGDVLVFYQHQTNRNGEPWIKLKLEQFERALGLPLGMAKVAVGTAIARDVALFYCCKDAE